jgi:hypothetical protein
VVALLGRKAVEGFGCHLRLGALLFHYDAEEVGSVALLFLDRHLQDVLSRGQLGRDGSLDT